MAPFQPEVHFSGGASPAALAVSDFNGNAIPDLAVADQAGSVTILVNVTTPPPALSNVSAASFLGGELAPASIVTAFGSQLAVRTEAAHALPLPTRSGVRPSPCKTRPVTRARRRCFMRRPDRSTTKCPRAPLRARLPLPSLQPVAIA